MDSWLQLAANRHPDRVAVESRGVTLTYSALLEAAAGTAAALKSQGVRPGTRVALELEDPLEFVIALHACLLLGGPAVPVDLRLREAERELRRRGAAVILRDRLPAGSPTAWAPAPLSDRQTATVMHTSGTTAEAKPVELSYANWLANALGSAVALGLDPAERWLCPMPMTHVGGLSIPVRSAVYATTAVVHRGFETDAVVGDLMEPSRRITLVSLVPTMLARLLDAGLEAPPTLRWALLGGGPIPPALLARARAARVPVAPTYGMTEACSQIATFGWPLPGVEIRVRDGEVLVRGPVVAAGAVADDGWLHTGDLGELDSRGRLEITGRRSETIVSGGENVAPAEVEAALLEHPSVVDAGVFGRPDPEWGEAVVAIVVLHDGATIDPAELRAFCAQRLAGFKVPKAVAVAATLPRTASGKLLRHRLNGLV
ncbi:MAG TPA: AMP-binding protein [Solirubrobacteraceae bacterium]|nr:AMP-binding protein [Solirubrobacteraceae bacterium]